MDTSDGITVALTGGLGNQLFGLAAGWEQSRRLACPLYLDTSRYSRGDIRRFELSDVGVPAFEVDLAPSSQRRFRKRSSGPVFTEQGLNYDERINGIEVGTRIVGYFQSPKYFPTVSDELAALLRAGDPESSRPTITAHVRRGDYLTQSTQEYHGIASREYFSRALSVLRRLMPESQVRVYSDSLDLVRSELTGLGELDFVDDEMTALATIRAMSRGSGMIMSNSSFSWWAAWLISRGTEAVIIAPRPWFASGDSASDLLLPDWLTLDARP